jgi:hypothetical protein
MDEFLQNGVAIGQMRPACLKFKRDELSETAYAMAAAEPAHWGICVKLIT